MGPPQFATSNLGALQMSATTDMAPRPYHRHPYHNPSPDPLPTWQTKEPSADILGLVNRQILTGGVIYKVEMSNNAMCYAGRNGTNLVTGIVDGRQQLDWGLPYSMAESSSGTRRRFGDTTGSPTFDSSTVDSRLEGVAISQGVHGGSMGRTESQSTSTIPDPFPIWTGKLTTCAMRRPSTAGAEKGSDRSICQFCFKSHTRPSRAIACENEHLGVQPFVCDGGCGDLAW
ncbi:hypothetical protein FRB91_004830 [Serendipita sp. 411]|nr:hypothetical protein FRB91_004830 [Serendipita sp. 411]